MRVTIKYNILITLAMIGYIVVLSPFLEDEETTMLLESMLEGALVPMILLGGVSLVLGVIISMLIIRSLWNRLFPRLCNWSEINLAESYALSVFVMLFFVDFM